MQSWQLQATEIAVTEQRLAKDCYKSVVYSKYAALLAQGTRGFCFTNPRFPGSYREENTPEKSFPQLQDCHLQWSPTLFSLVTRQEFLYHPFQAGLNKAYL